MALKYYLLTNNPDEILESALILQKFDILSDYLINQKNSSYWAKVLNRDESSRLFSSVVEKASEFPDTESASCLIKVLAAREDPRPILEIMSAWLENNHKLKSSRSLQTLYLINLIKYEPDNAEECALKLENYSVEEIINVALSLGYLNLCLKIFEKFEQWNYAFKIALYGLRNIELSKSFALKSGHSEAWHALAEFCLISGDPITAVEFAVKAGNFRRQKELIILLHLNEYYEELYSYLIFLKSMPNYEPIFERETFFCLMKLGRSEELDSFINSAAAGFANELGKVLYREGSIELAAKCFKQAGNNDRATSCFLQLGNVEEAAESAIKTTKYE